MNLTITILGVTVLALAGPALLEAQDTYYPLACRGPLSISVRNHARTADPDHPDERLTMDFPIAANPVAAGARVDGLAPGTCAWLDRPLGAEEPRTLRVRIDPGYFMNDHNQNTGLSDVPMVHPFLDCAADSGCVFVLPAISTWFDAVGVVVSGSDTRPPGTHAVLWTEPFSVQRPPEYLHLIRLASPARPTLSVTSSVEVVSPN